MYLTKFLLDPRDRLVRKQLANRYDLHRTLLSAYPDIDRDEIGLLYRLERSDQNEMRPLELLVQTSISPRWEQLDSSRLPALSADVKEFQPKPLVGDRYYFRLEGNPTIRRKDGDYAGRRVELRSMEEQRAWLERKAAQHGFHLLSLESQDLGKVLSIKADGVKKLTITHQAVLFQGALEVSDPELFKGALKNGVGSAKGFGFGLLSIAR